jgi:hypothetical protein
MVVRDANIRIQPILTKEQVVYEEALKSMKYAIARLKISQEGIDVDDVSQEKFDMVTKLFDEMDTIQRDFNIESQKIQQDINNRMRKAQDDANSKFGEVQNRYRELISSMKAADNGDKGECSTQACGTNMSKEKEDSLVKMLADELANAEGIKI